jgi:hypothetical protein
MSIKVMAWVWDRSPVAGTELLMLLAIADQTNDDGRDAWPSIDNLAKRTRLNRRTVQRVLQRLTAAGHIAIEEGGGRRRNRYWIVMTNPVDNQANTVDKLSTPAADRHPRQNATGGTPATPGVTEPRHPTPGAAVSPVTSYPVQIPSTTAPPDPNGGGSGGDIADTRAGAVLAMPAHRGCSLPPSTSVSPLWSRRP